VDGTTGDGLRRLEAGGWRLEVGGWRLEIGDWRGRRLESTTGAHLAIHERAAQSFNALTGIVARTAILNDLEGGRN
jgi:hypothetical protein